MVNKYIIQSSKQKQKSKMDDPNANRQFLTDSHKCLLKDSARFDVSYLYATFYILTQCRLYEVDSRKTIFF